MRSNMRLINMNLTLLIPVLLFAASCSSSAVKNASPEVKKFMDNTLLHTVGEAEKIESYYLLNVEGSAVEISGIPAKKGPMVEGETKKAFIKLLLDAKSYELVQQKRCPFIPEYALRFIKGNDVADVVFAVNNCPKVSFRQNGGDVMRDTDPSVPEQQKLFKTLFP